MEDNYPFSHPLSLGDLLDRTFRVYRARFGVLTLTAAFLLVPIGLLTGALTGRFMVSYFDFLEGLATSTAASPQALLNEVALPAAGFAGVTLLLALLGMVSNGLVSLAATRHIVDILQGKELSFWQGLRAALARFLPFVGMFLTRGLAMAIAAMSVLVIIGVLIFLVAAIIGGAALLLGDVVSEDAGIVSMIGFVILACCGYVFALAIIFVPIVYLSARWLVAVPALVAEKAGPLGSLRRSWRLTAKNVWRSVGYAILLSILNLLVITLPASIIQQILGILAPFSPTLIFGISGAITSVFNVLWQPLYAAAIVLLYYDLRVRRENFDLLVRVQQLEAEVLSGVSTS